MGTGISRVIAQRLPKLTRYNDALDIQKYYISKVRETCNNSDNIGYILLLEHTPTYTVGLRRRQYPEAYAQALTAKTGADFVPTKRGGLITFHGPGQLVSYPILSIKTLGEIGTLPCGQLAANNCYVNYLEQVVINFLKNQYEIPGERSPHTGVWVGDDKICAMGLRVEKGVSSHGIALNCNTDLDWYSHIVPCGIEDKGVTSLSKILGKNVGVDDVCGGYLKCFEEVFNVEVVEKDLEI